MTVMIGDPNERRRLSQAIGSALDEIVREHLMGLPEEPDITSRIGQRLEDHFEGLETDNHKIRAISQTLPSHGPGSLEKPTGADLYIAITVTGADGRAKSKGLLVQAKRHDKLEHAGDWRELGGQCERMTHITRKGSKVWVYCPDGIKVLDMPRKFSAQIEEGDFVELGTTSDLFEATFKCTQGDMRKTPDGTFGDRQALRKMLRGLAAKNAAWIEARERT